MMDCTDRHDRFFLRLISKNVMLYSEMVATKSAIYGDREKKIKGFSKNTTNNIMELTAAVESLKQLKRSCDIIITTDSVYVKNGITIWIKNWKRRNWKTSSKKDVKNKKIYHLLTKLQITLLIQ